MLQNHIEEHIKKSPYKREYIQNQLGVTANTMTSWVKGRTYPNAKHLFMLADILGVSVDDLYKYKKDE
ncbi:hypothetical protein M948_19425 [Virgibacillus sp. CM-4]|uniref:helix-turn-helix domain-containing protein n=1 Tax=Virgibacillus sp. CM-4 TaxID=1354277 RepID=UPI0003888AE8|nr:helix-turn-helix transcriptional regulator [Virgibacillus sp. CM-4]EQB35272.1 hypothetical protein M948_19425 [Virgibacillus sp. CM-4]